MTRTPPRRAPHWANCSILAGATAGICLFVGFVAGGIAMTIHGLGYFVAFPFWFLATALASLGVISSIRAHGQIDSGSGPTPSRSRASIGLAGSSIVLFFASILTAALAGLLALGALVAVGMLLSHPV